MKKVLVLLVFVFIMLQFFQIDKTNPPVNKGVDFLSVKNPPENIATNIRNACYDCHSNETKYPWYSTVQPVAWLLKNHIDEGRRELNFSTFATYEPKRQARKLEESAEMIENGKMPMDSYLITHADARLSDAQKAELVNYFKEMSRETSSANY
ncbi:MAG: heme-binding domain-containing protein [Cruoricaptor ignavus]|nr:heme-binding domain-containing protein [Cruoricaptor ignavus]